MKMDTKYKENYIRLGLKIAYYRKLRGMTQEQFAEAIRKSWSFIALVESPSKAAGVSLETCLFSGTLKKIFLIMNKPS